MPKRVRTKSKNLVTTWTELSKADREKLLELAKAEERSLSAQIRIIVRTFLAERSHQVANP